MQNHKRKAQCLSYDKTLTTIALGPLENKKKKKNAKWRFLLRAHVNCAIMAMLNTHSIGNQSWNTMVVF